MIFNIQPVPHVLSVAIDGERLSLARIQNHQRDQLLRKLVRPIVVGAIRGEDRQLVSVIVRAYQVIGSRLGCGVRTVWRVGSYFTESWIAWAERSVYFVGGNVQEAESLTIALCQSRPVSSRFFQQTECPVDIGADEIVGTMDRAVYMTFGGEMDDGTGTLPLQQSAHEITIHDVALLETISRVAFD